MRRVPLIGIVTCILYFAALGLFLITKTEFSLTIWEVLTFLSAPVMLIVFLNLCDLFHVSSINKSIMLVFMACAITLTSTAHIVNITVTRRLISEGVNIPNYLKIGYWPSVEMAIDYLAWGFFVGLAFLCTGISIHSKKKKNMLLKTFVLLCGMLCLIGFFGAIFLNENLWYLAPIGYGPGTLIICILMLKIKITETSK